MSSEESPRLREMFCSLGEISRGDGSVILCQGDTTVASAVYGPAEARLRHSDLIDRAGVEVVIRPRTGLAMVEDKARESRDTAASYLTAAKARSRARGYFSWEACRKTVNQLRSMETL